MSRKPHKPKKYKTSSQEEEYTMALFKGVGCSWGISGSASSGSTNVFGNFSMQSADVSRQGNVTPILSYSGSTIGWVGYDASTVGTFEYVVAGGASGGTATITTPSWGSKITVTGTPNPITSSAWIVKNVTIRATNTNAAVVTVQCQNWPNIT